MVQEACLIKRARHAQPASDQAFFQLQLSAFAFLSSCGFQGSSANACHVFAECIQRYITLLGRTATGMAMGAGRHTANIWDVIMSLEEIMGQGTLDELMEWANDEGIWRRTTTDFWSPTLRKEQAKLARLANHELCSQRTSFSFEEIQDEALYVELTIREALDQCLEDDLVWGTSAYVTGTKRPYIEERLQDDENSYIPSFLPRFPTRDAWKERTPADKIDRARAPKPKTEAKARPIPRAATIQGVPPSDELGEDGVRKVWRRRAMAYAGVLAESSGTRSELPSLDVCAKRRGPEAKLVPHGSTTSSIDAFMQVMDALGDDPTTQTPMLLTSLSRSHHTNPTSTSLMAAAFKRRRLAHAMADPLRYVPNDSMHGCVHVHPTSPSAAPGPSLLITIPPAKDGVDEDTHAATAAPLFTPVHPHGRTVAMVPPSGAQFPTMSYRHASHLYHAARMLQYPDMQRVFSRLSDPPAILDDHRTEQVYHGTAASRTQLSGTIMSVRHRDTLGVMVSRYRGANSILHASLERLRFHLAAEQEAQRRAALEDGRENEVEEPIRGERIKMPVKGTLVHSWDWQKADPYA